MNIHKKLDCNNLLTKRISIPPWQACWNNGYTSKTRQSVCKCFVTRETQPGICMIVTGWNLLCVSVCVCLVSKVEPSLVNLTKQYEPPIMVTPSLYYSSVYIQTGALAQPNRCSNAASPLKWLSGCEVYVSICFFQ